ncbi:MAG: hypothetical protein AB8B63_12375 [Granulosicoccus sp.]
MSIAIARPKLSLGAGAVQVDPWRAGLSNNPTSENDFSSWDYLSHVRVQREFRINHAAIPTELGVHSAKLLLVVRRGTGYGQSPRAIEYIDTIELCSKTETIRVDASFSSEALAGELWLLCDIVLADRPVGAGTLSPIRPGTRLWSDSHRIALEPDVRRFPTEVVHFSSLFPGRNWVHAPWFLHWSGSDPAQDVASAIRLYINADREDWLERIQSLDPLVLQTMMADVMSQVIQQVGLEVMDDDEGVATSIGRQAIYWRELSFGPQTTDELRVLLDRRPGEFQAAILAAAEMRGQVT